MSSNFVALRQKRKVKQLSFRAECQVVFAVAILSQLQVVAKCVIDVQSLNSMQGEYSMYVQNALSSL